MKNRVMLAAAVLAAALVAVLGYAPLSRAVDSFTVTAIASTEDLTVVKYSWKCNATGGKATQELPPITGRILLGVTNPGATAPTDNYDIYIYDAEGVDVFGGALNNRDTTTSEQATPHVNTTADYYNPRPVYGPLTFSLGGQANADAVGDLLIYYEK